MFLSDFIWLPNYLYIILLSAPTRKSILSAIVQENIRFGYFLHTSSGRSDFLYVND